MATFGVFTVVVQRPGLFSVAAIAVFLAALGSLVWMPGPVSVHLFNKVIGTFMPVADAFLITVLVSSMLLVRSLVYAPASDTACAILFWAWALRWHRGEVALEQLSETFLGVRKARISKADMFRGGFGTILPGSFTAVGAIHGLLTTLTAFFFVLEWTPLFVVCGVALGVSAPVVLFALAGFALRSPTSVLQ